MQVMRKKVLTFLFPLFLTLLFTFFPNLFSADGDFRSNWWSYFRALTTSSSYSQTEAHLRSKGETLQNIGSSFGIESDYWDLISKVVEKEKNLRGKYYVFYHGQKRSYRIVQDLLKLLSIRLGIYKAKDFNEFVFLRIPYNRYLTEFENVENFIQNFNSINDSSPYMSEKLLSVSLSLLGNHGQSLCCAWEYFRYDLGCFEHASDTRKLLKDTLNFFDLKLEAAKLEQHLDKLTYLNDSISTAEGNLFQIFISEKMVDVLVYLSHPFGIPYSDAIWGGQDLYFDFDVKRYDKISPILKCYCDNPTAISYDIFNALQGRILMTDNMLQPGMVKIFRYTTVPDDKMRQYERELSKEVDDIIRDSMPAAAA